jgi:hypothetical protein
MYTETDGRLATWRRKESRDKAFWRTDFFVSLKWGKQPFLPNQSSNFRKSYYQRLSQFKWWDFQNLELLLFYVCTLKNCKEIEFEILFELLSSLISYINNCIFNCDTIHKRVRVIRYFRQFPVTWQKKQIIDTLIASYKRKQWKQSKTVII